MKKTIIAAVSAFLLGMGAAHAEETDRITYEDICAMTKPGAPPIPEAKKNELLLYVATGIFCMDGEQAGAVKLLLEAGADPNAVDSEGKGALHHLSDGSSDFEADKCLDLLVKHGANVNIQDREGRTPLMIALANMDNVDGNYICHLLSAGADGNVRDHAGNVASQYVPIASGWDSSEGSQIQCMEMYELLDSYGYIVDVRDKMALFYILSPSEESNTYCSEEELRFLLRHGAETELECVFNTNRPLKWSMLDTIRQHPQYPDGKVLPMWRGIKDHERNIREKRYTTLKRLEEILLEHQRSTASPQPAADDLGALYLRVWDVGIRPGFQGKGGWRDAVVVAFYRKSSLLGHVVIPHANHSDMADIRFHDSKHCTIDAGRVAKVEVDLEKCEYVLSQPGTNGDTGKREKMSIFDFSADEVGFENNCELYYHPAREEWKSFYLRWSAYVL